MLVTSSNKTSRSPHKKIIKVDCSTRQVVMPISVRRNVAAKNQRIRSAVGIHNTNLKSSSKGVVYISGLRVIQSKNQTKLDLFSGSNSVNLSFQSYFHRLIRKYLAISMLMEFSFVSLRGQR